MTDLTSWSADGKARYFRLQNIIAERALRRGRKWTAREQIENLVKGLAVENENAATNQPGKADA